MQFVEFQSGMCSCHGRRRSGAAVGSLVLATLMFTAIAEGQSLQDLFTNRETFSTVTGKLVQTNHDATVETAEPKHGGKVGGHSLWISWVAPTNGVVEFETEASGFDTLLSAYEFTTATGATFTDLREVARADDSEGFEEESEIKFAVYTGDRYEIAVDGYFGAVGRVELKWKFEPLPAPPAKVIASPPDRSVNFGETVALEVAVTNAAGSQFKWYFNGNTIPAATSTNLVVANFQASNVGRYKFRVSSDGGSGSEIQYFSIPTEIQINTDGASNTLAQPKFRDTPATPLIGANVGGGGVVVRALGPMGSGGGITPMDVGVVRGYNGSQIFNTTYAVTDPLEPLHCGVAGGAAYWLLYQAPTNGTLTLNTIGSTYDTVLETYTYNGALTSYQDLITLACANDSFGTNGPAQVQLAVVKTREYLVAVNGVNAAFGTAWLNYSLNTNQLPQPPILTTTPPPLTVAAGTNVTLTAPVTGSIPMTFAWRKDTVLMAGQTAPALVLTNVTNTHSGNYSFTVTNDLGSVTGTFPLKVVVPPQCTLTPIPNGLQFGYPTLTGQVYTTEESTNLLTGWKAWPGSFVGNGLTNYFTVGNSGTKFYRVRVE